MGLLGEPKVGMLLTKFWMLCRSCASLGMAIVAINAIVSHCIWARIATVEPFRSVSPLLNHELPLHTLKAVSRGLDI